MEKRYFGLESISVNKLERLKWIVEEFLTTDLEALPYLKRDAFKEKCFRYLFEIEFKELTKEEATKYEQWIGQEEVKK